MKKIFIFLILLCTFCFIGCNSENDVESNPEQNIPEETKEILYKHIPEDEELCLFCKEILSEIIPDIDISDIEIGNEEYSISKRYYYIYISVKDKYYFIMTLENVSREIDNNIILNYWKYISLKELNTNG